MILQKECIAMFPTLAQILTRREKLDLIKTVFPLAFKETRSFRGIYRKVPYQRERSLYYQRLQPVNRLVIFKVFHPGSSK